MGQELDCRLRYRKQTLAGKAYLETDHLLFRGTERIKFLLKDVQSVSAENGVLTIQAPEGAAAFELGTAAAKWAEKILHPPSRLDKLGVKDGVAVKMVGDFAGDFTQELATRQVKIVSGRSKADVVLFAAEDRGALVRLPGLISGMDRGGAIWVIYPKGVSRIREIEVIQAGRDAGLKDVKVASFSATHTGLKFMAPAGGH